MLNTIRQSIEGLSTTKQIIGLTAIASSIAFGYYLWNNSKKTPQKKQKMDIAVSRSSSSASLCRSSIGREKSHKDAVPEIDSPQKALIKKINTIKQTLGDGNKITFQTVVAIYNCQYQLARKQVASLFISYRAQRRNQKVNIDDYQSLKSYCTLAQNFEQAKSKIYRKILDAILANFHISFTAWIELVDECEQKNKDQWQDVILAAEDDQLLALRPKDRPKIKYVTLSSIYEFKIQKMEEILEKLKDIDIELADKCLTAEKLVEDFVFQKFKYEEQDVKFSEEKLADNEKNDLKKLQDDFADLRSTIFGVFDDEEEQQAEQIEQK